MMLINLSRISGTYHMQALNSAGNSIETDIASSEGGTDKAMSPLEVLLSSLGACSSVDVILILEKQRQNLKDIGIEIEADRDYDSTPALFTSINIHFKLFGDIVEKKAERAIQFSVDKYCTVAQHLKKSGVNITTSYKVIKMKSQ